LINFDLFISISISISKLGYLGSLKLKIPWKKLKTEPVIIEITDIYALVLPKTAINVQNFPFFFFFFLFQINNFFFKNLNSNYNEFQFFFPLV